MKVLAVERGGNIDNLKMMKIPKPIINENEVLVKVKAVSLNPSDYQTIEYYGELSAPVVLGLDIAGEVVEIGENIKNYRIGDRVFYIRKIDNPYGGFGEYSTTSEMFLNRIPDGVSYEEAATLPGAGMTACHIMEQRFHIVSGRTILIQAGAGGVGSFSIQIAKKHGLKVITTCLERDIDYVKELGADMAIDFQKEDVYKRILEFTKGKGVDYVISCIGPEGATKDLSIMGFDSEIACLQGLPDFSKWKFYERSLSVHEVALSHYLTSDDIGRNQIIRETGQMLSNMIYNHEINTPKKTVIRLEEVPVYLKMIKEGKITGKVVAIHE